ncbi:MAG: hypothetical protein SFU99_23865 [Saprospiraceae bacterium]|nr:hypothetical protein [Saprospiraceae bacterium]
MKLRCAENSVRLRLRKSDIELLKKQGFVREEVNFGASQMLSYELQIAKQIGITATFENGRILVQIPENQYLNWVNSEQVSLEKLHPLHILIEKDFPCKHTATEDKEDTFYELAD